MDFAFDELQQLFQNAARDFATREVAPIVEEAEAKDDVPMELLYYAKDSFIKTVCEEKLVFCFFCEGAKALCFGHRAPFHGRGSVEASSGV
mgnify:CR=1 FL=1